MYLYNITFATEEALEKELTQWLKFCFIPDCVDNDMENPALLKIMANAEPGTVSLAVHFHAQGVSDIENWYADCGSRLFAEVLERWGQRVVFFPTMMECL